MTGNIGAIVIALSVGALAGVGLTLFCAPHSGKETREFISDKSRELKDKAEETIHDAQKFIKG